MNSNTDKLLSFYTVFTEYMGGANLCTVRNGNYHVKSGNVNWQFCLTL